MPSPERQFQPISDSQAHCSETKRFADATTGPALSRRSSLGAAPLKAVAQARLSNGASSRKQTRYLPFWHEGCSSRSAEKRPSLRVQNNLPSSMQADFDMTGKSTWKQVERLTRRYQLKKTMGVFHLMMQTPS